MSRGRMAMSPGPRRPSRGWSGRSPGRAGRLRTGVGRFRLTFVFVFVFVLVFVFVFLIVTDGVPPLPPRPGFAGVGLAGAPLAGLLVPPGPGFGRTGLAEAGTGLRPPTAGFCAGFGVGFGLAGCVAGFGLAGCWAGL